jgi:hypothetical protein
MIIIGVDFHPEFQQILRWILRAESSRKNGWRIRPTRSSSTELCNGDISTIEDDHLSFGGSDNFRVADHPNHRVPGASRHHRVLAPGNLADRLFPLRF